MPPEISMTVPSLRRVWSWDARPCASTSAVPLSPDAVTQLQQSLQQLTQRNVVLETRVDPALLGGVSAQVGGTLYDGTLRTQLEQLRRELK